MQNIITTKISTQIGTVVYPVVRPSSTLAYSTLWRPNGRGLQSTPLKRSKDPLEYHSVLLCFSQSRLRGISTTWSLSPLQLKFTKRHRARVGMNNAHKTIPWFGQVQHLPTPRCGDPTDEGCNQPLSSGPKTHLNTTVFCFAFLNPVCEESPQLGASRPYN